MLHKLMNVFEKWRPETKIIWTQVLKMVFLHSCFFYAFRIVFTQSFLKTFIFNFIVGMFSRLSVTAGYHRLWSHRSYQAKLPLRIFLGILCSITAEGTIYQWSHDHRVHHRYSETNADPYNVKRGFFFAHMGWMMCERHPEFATKAKKFSTKDLDEDVVVWFNAKFYFPLVFLLTFYLPTMIPVWYWDESLLNAFIWSCTRHTVVLNLTWLINSATHTFGTRPCDKNIAATNNALVAFINGGEGNHNYHHSFPWDYRSSELGYYLNTARRFIEFMAFIGQAYDLKTATPETVKNRIATRGDGTKMVLGN